MEIAVPLLLALLALAFVGAAAAYNALADLRQDVRDAWGAMDAQLRRRADLIPPLASLLRASGEPPPPAVAALMSAKNQAAVAFNPQQLAAAEATLTVRLRELLASPPPTLAAHAGYAKARADLRAADGAVEAAGRRYNAAVESYNAALHSFPQTWAAVAFGFRPQPTFDLPAIDGTFIA